MIKPIPTTCIAISFGIPKIEQARGINIKEPPATPEDPQAHSTEAIHIKKADGKSMLIPKV